MSLDNESAKTIQVFVQAHKARSDFMEAVYALYLAIVVAIQEVDEALAQEKVWDRFSSALELAVPNIEARLLSEDEKEQYRRIYEHFQEMVQTISQK